MEMRKQIKALSATPLGVVILITMLISTGAIGAYILWWQSQTVQMSISFEGLSGMLLQTGATDLDTANNYVAQVPCTSLVDSEIRLPGVSDTVVLAYTGMVVIEDGYFDDDLRLQIDVTSSIPSDVVCTGYWMESYDTSDGLHATYWDTLPMVIPVNVNGGSEYYTVPVAEAQTRFLYDDPVPDAGGEFPADPDMANAIILTFEFAPTDGGFGAVDFDITLKVLGDDA